MATEKATPDEGVKAETPQGPIDGDWASRFAVATWANDVGRWSGIIILVVIVLVFVFFVLAATKVLFLAALFAVLFAGTFLPMVDWLQKHHIKRGLGAIIVTALLILLGIAIGALIVYSVLKQIPTIDAKLTAAWDDIQKTLKSTSISQDQIDTIKTSLQTLAKNAASGLAGTAVDLIGGVASLIFGLFISLNILVWCLIQGRKLGRWASKRMGPVPPQVAYDILANSARFFRGYLYGSTLVGLFNGAVMGVGALIIGVPLAGDHLRGRLVHQLHPVLRRDHQRRVRRPDRARVGRAVQGHPDADHRHHLERLPADDRLAVRPGIGAQAAPAGGALRHDGGQRAVRRRGRDLRGAVPQDLPRRAPEDEGRRAVRSVPAVTGQGPPGDAEGPPGESHDPLPAET